MNLDRTATAFFEELASMVPSEEESTELMNTMFGEGTEIKVD